MGLFDRLFGSDQQDTPTPAARPRSTDEIAVERYRYLLRTAPPETLEQVHAEAFAKLTDEQRTLVYQELAQSGEQPRGTDAASLAQAATRSEIRQPGTLERSFNQGQAGPSFGSMVGSTLLGTVAGYVIGSALVSAFLPDLGADASADAGTGGGDAAADPGASADQGANFGGGDSGFGDFGGGDFGGGDFF